MLARIFEEAKLDIDAITLRFATSINEIPAAAWNLLAGSQAFLQHAFLEALESTGCVSSATGWQPHHATLWTANRLVAAMPLYLKSHSYGEYVFDWRWAEAYQQACGRYYPKLLCAIPFTPVPGPRLLGASADDQIAMLTQVLAWAEEQGLSSFHCLFPETANQVALAQAGLLSRQGFQFHWRNPGYENFDNFLATLTHDKRKKIRQERRKVLQAGLRFETRSGAEISESDWAFFHRCYVHTYRMHHSTPYLNLDFFTRIGNDLADHTAMVLGYRDGHPLCAALNLFDRERLYGRYWGAMEYVPGLHFEACYYQGMEFCIEQKLSVFEGGAQGEHKLARGFMPVETRSWHWLADKRFGKLVGNFLEREGHAIEHYVNELEGPYKTHPQS